MSYPTLPEALTVAGFTLHDRVVMHPRHARPEAGRALREGAAAAARPRA